MTPNLMGFDTIEINLVVTCGTPSDFPLLYCVQVALLNGPKKL